MRAEAFGRADEEGHGYGQTGGGEVALVHSRRVVEVRTRCRAVRWAAARAGRRGVDSGAAVIGGKVLLSDGRLH